MLRTLVHNHFVREIHLFDKLECGGTFETVAGNELQIRCFLNKDNYQIKFVVSDIDDAFGLQQSEVVLSGLAAKIIGYNNEAKNGILHVVNNLIIPDLSTAAPSGAPTVSNLPSVAPSAAPTVSMNPSEFPSGAPAVSMVAPSAAPTVSMYPSEFPSGAPTV